MLSRGSLFSSELLAKQRHVDWCRAARREKQGHSAHGRLTDSSFQQSLPHSAHRKVQTAPPALLVRRVTSSRWLITVWLSQETAFPKISPSKTKIPPNLAVCVDDDVITPAWFLFAGRCRNTSRRTRCVCRRWTACCT